MVRDKNGNLLTRHESLPVAPHQGGVPTDGRSVRGERKVESPEIHYEGQHRLNDGQHKQAPGEIVKHSGGPQRPRDPAAKSPVSYDEAVGKKR